MLRLSVLGTVSTAALVLAACSGSAVSPPASGGFGSTPSSLQSMALTSTLPAGYTFVDLGAGPNGGAAWGYAADKSYQGGTYVYTRDSCGKDCSFNVYHALVWSGSGSTPIDITPPLVTFAEAWVYGGSGSVLVGTGVTDNGGYFGVPHALVWRGASFAWKDINPAGDSTSHAYATSGGSVVGSGSSSALHALLWSLTNVSNPVDLHPGSAYASSEAFGVYGTNQVGYATTTSTPSTQHAMLWNGTAGSAVDLTPANVTGATAYAVDSAVQAGCGVVAPATSAHALLWQGTATSMRDLNPAGFTDSCVRAAHSGVEAGYGHASTGALHAVAWGGTAKSAMDLQQFMPSTYTQSQAYAIDSLGNIIGTATSSTGTHAVMWIPQ